MVRRMSSSRGALRPGGSETTLESKGGARNEPTSVPGATAAEA